MSSIPIAVVLNVLRFIGTVALWVLVSSRMAEQFFHDSARVTMMPAVIALFVGEW